MRVIQLTHLSGLVSSSHTFTDLDALRAALPETGRNSLFRTVDWFKNLHAYGLEAVPALSALRLPTDAHGCLPLLDDGEQLQALSNYYSSLYGPVGDLPENLKDFLRENKRAIVDLHPLDPCAPEFQQLKTALTKAGYWVSDYFCFGNWYYDVASRSFSDYLAERPSQLRNTLQRGKGKLDKAGGDAKVWRIDIQQHEDEKLEAAIAAFERVYAKSWKQAEPQPEFIPNLCRTAARAGWLRLGLLYVNNEPIAAQLWLTYAGVGNIYKLAYDEEASRYSAGTVLTAAMFEQALDVDRVAEVDYLNGDEPYKRDWMAFRRERRGIIAFDLTQWRGFKAALRHWAGRVLHPLRQDSRQEQ